MQTEPPPRPGWLAPNLPSGGEALLAVPSPLALTRLDGTLVLCNQPLLDLLRLPAEEVRARGLRRLIFPPEEAGVSWIGSPGRSGAAGRVVRRLRLADGSLQLIEWVIDRTRLGDELFEMTVAVTPVGRGEPVGPFERGPADLAEDAPVILARLDRQGRLLYVNRVVQRYTGMTPEACIADTMSFWGLVPDDRRAAAQNAFQQALEGTTSQVDVPIDHKAGGRTILQVTFTPIAEGGGPASIVEAAATDITALVEQAELRALREARASFDRLQSQLLGAVSHELRSPLVSIKGYNDLLLRGVLGPLAPPQRKRLEIAGANIDRLVELIETLLDFAHREEGRLELRRARVDLREVLREAAAQLTERIQSRGIHLHLELPETPLLVSGDRTRLIQVTRALLTNAEKFSEAGGGQIHVVVRDLGDSAEFDVTDQGIGIPAAAQARVFDRFYQVDASSTRRFGGTGLGLALAKEIVTQHGGAITVRSSESSGSTFTVRLPVADPAGGVDLEPQRSVVLVGAPRGALRELDRLPAVDLVRADTYAEVIRRARRHRPDLVVVALQPGETRALVDTLRQDPESGARPIVAVAPPGYEEPLGRADLVVPADDPERLIAGIEGLLADGPPRDRPLKVVIVDDEPEIVDFTRFVLEREGYQVAAVQNGEAAINAIGADCDLVLLDVALEGMDGIELCRRLRAQGKTRRVPILMVSGMGSDEVRRGAFGAGADGYLLKPFGVDELLRQIRVHVRHPRRGIGSVLAGQLG